MAAPLLSHASHGMNADQRGCVKQEEKRGESREKKGRNTAKVKLANAGNEKLPSYCSRLGGLGGARSLARVLIVASGMDQRMPECICSCDIN